MREVGFWKAVTLAVGLAVVSGVPSWGRATAKVVARHRLANGLRVVISEDHNSPFVTVAVAYRAGAMYEPKGRAGMAHLVEHMMFKGSLNVAPNEHLELMDSHDGVGAAFTTKELTSYRDNLPATHLTLALRLEADRMRSLTPSPRDLDLERSAVVEEQNAKRPYGSQYQIFSPLFYQTSAYAIDPGSVTELADVSVDEIVRFHHAYYGPNSAVISLVGDITTETALKEVETAFDGLTPRQRPPEPSTEMAPQTSERKQHGTDPTGRGPLVLKGFHIPEALSPDHDAMLVASTILRQRLRRTFVKEQQIASSVVVFLDDVRGPGAFIVKVLGNVNIGVDQLDQAVDQELTKAIKDTITSEEATHAVKSIKRQLIEEEGLRNRADALARYELLHDQPTLADTQPDRLGNVTAAHVQRALRTYVTPANRTTLTLVRPSMATADDGFGGPL